MKGTPRITVAFEEGGPPLEELLRQILEQDAAFWQEDGWNGTQG